MTDQRPYSSYNSDLAVYAPILTRELPAQVCVVPVEDNIKLVLERCWHQEPESRPVMDTCLLSLDHDPNHPPPSTADLPAQPNEWLAARGAPTRPPSALETMATQSDPTVVPPRLNEGDEMDHNNPDVTLVPVRTSLSKKGTSHREDSITKIENLGELTVRAHSPMTTANRFGNSSGGVGHQGSSSQRGQEAAQPVRRHTHNIPRLNSNSRTRDKDGSRGDVKATRSRTLPTGGVIGAPATMADGTPASNLAPCIGAAALVRLLKCRPILTSTYRMPGGVLDRSFRGKGFCQHGSFKALSVWDSLWNRRFLLNPHPVAI